jgi:hypothetical protein
LSASDRDTLVLRYFQNKTLAEVGATLGIEERAAQKRVGRALEKLRTAFSKRGVTLSTTIIAGAVAANSVQAAPTVLAGSIAGAATNSSVAGAAAFPLVSETLQLMGLMKLKLASSLAAAVLLAGGAGVAMLQATKAGTAAPTNNHIATAEITNRLSPRELLDRVIEATMAVNTMTADFRYSVDHPVNPPQVVTGSVRMMKPNFICVTYTSIARPAYPSLIASDGTTRWSYTSSGFRFRRPYTSPEDFDPLLEAQYASGLISGGGKITTNIVERTGSDLYLWDSIAIQAFFGPEYAVNRHLGDTDDFESEGEEVVNGVPYRVLYHRIEHGNIAGGELSPLDQRLYVGPDNLIHRYVLGFTSREQAGVQTMELSNVRTNLPMRAEDFAFTPPE